MTVKQGVCLFAYLVGAVLAGLAFIHFVWRNPVILGPFALMIGMTPLVLLFEYSLEIPGYWFWLGSAVAGIGWFVLQPEPPSGRVLKMVSRGGGLVAGLSVLAFVLASAYYNVGASGPTPAGWEIWARPGIQFAEAGAFVLAAGLLLERIVNLEWDDCAH